MDDKHEKKVISRKVMIRKDCDRFRFQSQSDKMPGDIPVKQEYSVFQEAEVEALLGLSYNRGYDDGYARGLEAARLVAEKTLTVKEPMSDAPTECWLCHGVMDGYAHIEVAGKKFPVCNKCHKIHKPVEEQQVNILDIPIPDQPCTTPFTDERSFPPEPVTGSPTCKGDDHEVVPHFAPGTLTSLYGSAPDATDGDGDTWQEPEPHSLTPAMAARPAEECTDSNKALEPMEVSDGE